MFISITWHLSLTGASKYRVGAIDVMQVSAVLRADVEVSQDCTHTYIYY